MVARSVGNAVKVGGIVVVVVAALVALLWTLPRLVGPGDGPSATPSPGATTPTDDGSPAADAGDLRGVTADAPVAGAGPALAFTATGLAGGGFQNVVAFAPDGSSVLVGGDNGGLHRSTDGGVTWTPVSAGLPAWTAKIAAIAYDPSDPQVVLAGGGFSGRTGGVLRSEDGGRSWEVVSDAVRFSGSNTPGVRGLPNKHPRSTGELLVWDGEVVFAGSFDDGVHRSTDGGRSWTSLGLEGSFVRGMTLANDGSLAVATHADGLLRIEEPTGAARVVTVAVGPRDLEEVAALPDGGLLVAAGVDGVWRWDGAWSPVLQQRTTWTSVAVGADGTLWAAAHATGSVGDERHASIVRSRDGGETWDGLAVGDGLRLDVLGSDGLRWWVAQAQGSFLPDGQGYTAAQVVIDPTDPTHVLVAGRAGVWSTSDGGDTWNPAVAGLGVTAHDATAVTSTGRIAIANTDHRLLVSDDDLRSVRAVEPGATKGTAVAADETQPGTLLVSTGERDGNRDGELYRVPVGDGRPQSLGLAAHTGGQRVVAVTSGFDADGRAVVVAAVEEGGIWRLVDDGWEQAGTDAFRRPQPTADAQAVWLAGTQTVVALDRTTGLWRSTNAGVTWDSVLQLQTATDRTDPTGFLSVDPTTPGRVWLSSEDGLRRVDGLDASPVVTDVSLPVAAGPVLVLDDGGVVVVGRDRRGVLPSLVHLCGSTVQDVAVGARFTGGAIDAFDLDLDAVGHLIVTTGTNGVLRSAVPVADVLRCVGGQGDTGT